MGNHGVLLSCRSDAVTDSGKLLSLSSACEHTTLFYAPPKLQKIVNVSGAGDSFCAGFITALLKEHTLDECVAAGFASAERALLSESAVPMTYFQDTQKFENYFKENLKKMQRQKYRDTDWPGVQLRVFIHFIVSIMIPLISVSVHRMLINGPN